MTVIALKKYLVTWLMPLPLAILLLLAGCICLGRRPRLGRGLVTAALLLILVCSCTAISNLLLLPLEERYPKWDGEPAGLELVVVMGASQGDAPRLPLSNRPNTAAVYRLLEGIALYRANPGSKLILSGGVGSDEPHAVLMQRVAEEIGVPAQDLLLQAESFDTEDEVRALLPLVRGHRFGVVTSAAHMPRTMASFEAAGLQPLPAPTHFLNRDNPHPNWRDFTVPTVDSLARSEFAVHEYLGLAWLRLKQLLQ